MGNRRHALSLSATLLVGVVACTTIIPVDPVDPVDPPIDGDAPTIIDFRAVDGLVNPGLSNTLTWVVENHDRVTLNGPGTETTVVIDDERVTSVATPELPGGAVFNLVAANAFGEVSSQLLASRSVPTMTILIAGQSNAHGVNLLGDEATEFIRATERVRMLGNDYVWKDAYEPINDCNGQVDEVTLACNSGVSSGVSLGNRLSATTGGEVLLIPAATGSTSAEEWLPGGDPYDRETLFGSAAHRARLGDWEQAAPIGLDFEGRAYGAMVWFQGEKDTRTLELTEGFYDTSVKVLNAFQRELDAPILLAQLTRRGGSSATERNLLYQRVRETQRLMETGSRRLDGSPASESRPRHYLVVTHDLPMSDLVHISAAGQVELGRRLSLAIRQHLLGEVVDGTGPRLVRIEKVDDWVVEVHSDQAVRPPASTGADAYSGYFAVFAGGRQIPVNTILRDPDNLHVVRITLSEPATGAVEVRYMPPPVAPSSVTTDVIRSATCDEPMPDTSLCLPMPAFGATTAATTLQMLRFFHAGEEDEEP
jgi:hypothetical protein